MDTAIATSTRNTKSWKQWFLIYPSFAIAVIGAVPQYVKVFQGMQLGVASDEVSYVKRQHELFVRNINCHPSLESVTTATNSIVSVGACPSGDIQVNIERPDSNMPIVRWFGFEQLNEEVASVWRLLVPASMASERTKKSTQAFVAATTTITVICQKMLRSGKLIRTIKKDNKCFQQTINTYTGKVEEQKLTACNASC